MCFRPATLGKDPRYVLNDPGHEYIPGVCESFFGPLAKRWGIDGQRATLEMRKNLYQRTSPDGKTLLLPHVSQERYRPVQGGPFHASKQLDAWLTTRDPETRKRAERAFAECAKETVLEVMSPKATSRTGHAGEKEVPADSLYVLFKHVCAADGRYHLHVHLEGHNLGLNPDGKYRTTKGFHYFLNQIAYSQVFEAKLAHRLDREFGLTILRNEYGLEVKGFEALRGVKTPQQEKIDEKLRAKGLPKTPKTLHWAATEAHREGEKAKTAEEAVGRSWEWLRSKGIHFARGVFSTARGIAQRHSLLVRQRAAEAALKRSVRGLARLGQHVTANEFKAFAWHEASRRRVDPAVFADTLKEALKSPERWGLLDLDNGKLTTPATERSRLAWKKSMAAISERDGQPVARRSFDKARLEVGVPDVATVEAAREFLGRRGSTVTGPSMALQIAIDAYHADGRRVLSTMGLRRGESRRERFREAQMRHLTRAVTRDPNRLAVQVSKTSLYRVFLEMRRHRWHSFDQVVRLCIDARKPQVQLTRDDVLVIDADRASHHAMKAIMSAARKAKATVHLVLREDPQVKQYQYIRNPQRDDRSRE